MNYKVSDYLKSIVSAFLLASIFLTPLMQVKAQFGFSTVSILADWSPQTQISLSNSTAQLAETIKQGVVQVQQASTADISLAKQVAEYATVASRWVETVSHYTNEIFQFARQFTSMKGVLGFALQSIGVKENDLNAMKEWAVALYAVINLKKQFEALWESRITLFRSWWGRTKNGIFDPNADWTEMQNYFINSVGRRGYEYQLEADRLQQIDLEFAKWKQELEMWRVEEIHYVTQIKKVEEELQKEQAAQKTLPGVSVDDQTGQGNTTGNERMVSEMKVATLSNQLTVLQGNLAATRKEISRLLDLMTARYVYYYTVYAQGMKDADSYAKEISGWDIFEQIKQDAGNLMAPSPNEKTPPSY